MITNMLRCYQQILLAIVCGAAASGFAVADGELSASDRLEVAKMVYAQAGHYQDKGRLEIRLRQGDDAEQMLSFVFNTLFARSGPFRYEFRGESHPEVILIRSDGVTHGFFWSGGEDEVALASVDEGLLQAAPVTRGLSRWIPGLLLADTPEGMSILDADSAELVETTTLDGRSAGRLLLDANTPMERTLWMDDATFLVLKLESKRTSSQGEMELSAVFEPMLDQPIAAGAYTEGVRPAEDTVLQVRRQDGYALPTDDEVLATVFGEDLRLHDVYPDGVPDKEQLRGELGTAVGQSVFQKLIQVFMQARGYTVNDAERADYVDYQSNRLAAHRDHLQGQLRVGDHLADEERTVMQARVDTINRQLSSRTELESGLRAESEAMVRLWKLNRDLYNRYGGRVVQSEAGPEPMGAYQEFVAEQLEAGRVVIPRDDLQDGLQEMFDPAFSYEIPTSQVDFDRPWWQLGRE